jgi:hypothetical protein
VSRLLLLAAVLVAAGCGGGDGTTTGAAGGATALTVEVYPQGPGGAFATYELGCDPADGSIPDPQAACDDLDEVDASTFAPVPRDTTCSQEFDGPQLAKVTGTLRGEKITEQFSRSDGCQSARWDKLAFLFPTDDGT